MNYIGEILYAIILILSADYQARIFAQGKAISHFWWAAANGVLIAGAWLLRDKDYWLAGALVLERVWLFNPTLNLMRQKPFFYTGSGRGSSWIDDHYGYLYPFAFGISLVLFTFIQFHL